MKALLWKDLKISKWWIFTNSLIILTLGIIGSYLSYFTDFPGIILIFISMVGILFWSIFSGVSHYFNEDQGNAREFLNTLPVPRWKMLLSKALLLLFENLIYWALILFFLYINLTRLQLVDLRIQTLFIFYLSAFISTYTISIISLSVSALTKEMPARLFLTILIIIVSLFALNLIPSPHVEVRIPELSNRIDLGYLIKNFLSSFVFFVGSSFWVERRGF